MNTLYKYYSKSKEKSQMKCLEGCVNILSKVWIGRVEGGKNGSLNRLSASKFQDCRVVRQAKSLASIHSGLYGSQYFRKNIWILL